MKRHFWLQFLVVVCAISAVCPASMGQYVYWADTYAYTINRAKIDGTDQQTILYLGFEGVQDLALDLEQGKIYWTNASQGAIERCNLNGSARETIVTNVSKPFGIALDAANSKIYWSAHSPSRVQRSDFDGRNLETLIASGIFRPRHIALNVNSGMMYIASEEIFPNGSIGRFHRAKLDGSGLTLLFSGPGQPTQISLDHQAGKMYWGETVTNVIKRANLDGSAVETIVPPDSVSPLGLVVDPWGRKLYWVDSVTDDVFMADARIRRSNLDGSSIETLIPTGLFEPRTLALFTECIDANDGALCRDGNPCTDDDHCANQQCVGAFNANPCDDANACTVIDHCVGGYCIGTPATMSCDDRADCTLNDTCAGYSCVGEPESADCFRFYLSVTKVNGTACPSCPTSNVPISEVLPGDVVTVEAFLENWEDDPDTGICDNNAPCSVSAQDCANRHCSLANGVNCLTDHDCGSEGPCVPDQCDPAPGLGAYQWTLDYAGLSAGIDGALNPLQVPCMSDADCHHELPLCTCQSATCTGGTCDLRGALFVDESHTDYVFRDVSSFSFYWGDNPINPFPGLGAGALERGVADPERPVYLGTLILRVSENARGTFVVDVDRGEDFTFVLDQDVFLLEGLNITPATINLCDVVDSPNDCNANDFPDECEPDGDGDGLIDACDPCPTDASNDSDGDGVCESQDGCPDDALKSAPGTCRCGFPDSGDADADGVLDCVDACPGVNDTLYGADCASAIPAVSSWGLVILALLMLTVAKLGAFPRKVDLCHS